MSPNSTAAWKIVAFHKSAYVAGGHGEDANMVAMSQQIFEPNDVAMTLTGHSHFYQHTLVNDIHHMVIGSFGAPLYDPGSAGYTVMRRTLARMVLFSKFFTRRSFISLPLTASHCLAHLNSSCRPPCPLP